MNILEYIFPKQCINCSKIGEYICNSCIRDLKHVLPSCFVCKRLSNGYCTHDFCSSKSIQCFKGWYISNRLNNKLKNKVDLGIYSYHRYLLDILLKHIDIQNTLSCSNILPLVDTDNNVFRLNIYLSKYLSKNTKHTTDILLVGNRISDIDRINTQIAKLSKKDNKISILVLFEEINQ